MTLLFTSAMLPGLALAQQPQPFPRPADRTARPPAPAQPEPSERPDSEAPPPERDRRIPEDKLTGREVESPPQTPDDKPLSTQSGAGNTSASPKQTAQARRSAKDVLTPDEPVPTAATLGFPLFSGARFLRSYSAGQGQRYYVFGATASYTEVVSFYNKSLRSRGNRVFDSPPVHIFEEGRFDENRMAFPPSVTVKDYTWGNAEGYLDPRPGAQPERYPTVIQIVPMAKGR
ncbi:MAG: hypothetical protein ACRD2X_07895 [Vicinamibacteraceae bacterium]